jgi:hypothetical protein
MTLRPNVTPGRSEMSYGAGLAVNPESDFQSQRDLVFPQGKDKRDLVTEYRAQLRTDATLADENILPDMLYVEGNPDAFGPGLPLVREAPVRPKGAHPQPKLRYGVDRQA